jgi:PAS domain S-box-containing protein
MLGLACLPALARWAVRLLWAGGATGLIVFAAAAAGGPGDPTGDGYRFLFAALVGTAAALCMLRALLVAEQRWTWALCGAGMLCWATGEILFFTVVAGEPNPPYPSVVDALWLGYYGLSFAALLTLMATGFVRFRTSLWIDALVGGLAVAAIGAALLVEPILEGTGGSVAAIATTLAYPLIDVLIVGLLIGVFAISNGRPGRVWIVLGAVWAALAVIDTMYLLQTAAGTYAFGTMLDVSWAALMFVIAFAAWHRPTVTRCTREEGWGSLVVTTGFTVTGLSLITYGHWHHLHDAAVVLATLTLVVASVRTTMTFADMRALAHRSVLEKQNKLVLDAAGEGIFGTDARGEVTVVNPAGARMTGYAADELIGRTLHQALHHTKADGTPYPIHECPIHASQLDGTVRHCDQDVYWRKDGTSFAVEYTGTPLMDGSRFRGTVVVLRDISARREIERVKDEFTSVVSHELRTPLTSIRGSLGLLESGVLGPLGDRAQRMIHIAVQNTDRLVRLINDILDLERLDSDALHLRESPCDAAQLIARATDAMLPAAVAADVTLAVDAAPAAFEADEDRLIQTLTNLISNAVKFSPAGGTVLITAERRSDEILFSIRDDGPGIPADRLESIFGRFAQLDSSDSRQTGGTGLGLAISRSIVEQHGGRIWALSAPGGGSTFSFVVPAPADVAAEYTPRTGGVRGTILMCDDHPGTLEVTGTALAEHGYRAILSLSGEQAVELAVAEHPDVILLDLQMPGMSGAETVAALRGQAETAGIPVVVLSVLPRSEEQMTRHGLADWIQKPAEHADLFAALARAIRPRDDTFRVLFVERDPAVGAILSGLFDRHGVASFAAADAHEAVALCREVEPDLILLDDDLADIDGLDVKRWLRLRACPGELAFVGYDARDVEEAEGERRSVGAVTQILTRGQITAEDFQWRVMTLLARPRSLRGTPEADHEPEAHSARR